MLTAYILLKADFQLFYLKDDIYNIKNISMNIKLCMNLIHQPQWNT